MVWVVHEVSGKSKWFWLRLGDKDSHGFLIIIIIIIMSLVYEAGHYFG